MLLAWFSVKLAKSVSLLGLASVAIFFIVLEGDLDGSVDEILVAGVIFNGVCCCFLRNVEIRFGEVVVDCWEGDVDSFRPGDVFVGVIIWLILSEDVW